MKVRFQSLQDNLRAAIWARLERGDLTGSRLAVQAGFQQAHLSNFLNSRRGLSLQAMDQLLDALHLDVLDLAEVNEASRHGYSPAPATDKQLLAVVPLQAAARYAKFGADQIHDTFEVEKSLLRRLKPRVTGNRRDWTRFVMTKVAEQEVTGMAPLVNPGALLLLDRHYNSPSSAVDPPDPNLYAVRNGNRCLVRRVTATRGNLLLRPLNEGAGAPIELLAIPPGQHHGYFIIGRVRYLAMEL